MGFEGAEWLNKQTAGIILIMVGILILALFYYLQQPSACGRCAEIAASCRAAADDCANQMANCQLACSQSCVDPQKGGADIMSGKTPCVPGDEGACTRCAEGNETGISYTIR